MSKVPSYLRHISGQARTVINGKTFYLGRYGSKASKQQYDALVAEYLGAGRSKTFGIKTKTHTMADIMLGYMKYAKSYYGTGETSEVHRIKLALRPVARLYSELPANEFATTQYRAVQQAFVNNGIARTTTNAHMKRIVRMLNWAVIESMFPVDLYATLKLIPGLRAGKSEAKETKPVQPVPLWRVERTIEKCSPVVAAMINLQLLTGCRPGEICSLTRGMIDTTQDVWEAKLEHHKSAHRGKIRVIYFGKQAQLILQPFLARNADEKLFRPCDSMAQTRRLRVRKTPLGQGNRAGYSQRSRSGRPPKRSPGTEYNTNSYGRAIAYACKQAFPYPKDATKQQKAAWREEQWWSPNQLRHTSATRIRKQFGLEAAGVILGHSKMSATQIYAEQDREKAIQIVKSVG